MHDLLLNGERQKSTESIANACWKEIMKELYERTSKEKLLSRVT